MKKGLSYIIFVLMLSISCSTEEKPITVAQVGNHFLYLHEIEEIAPKGMAKQDSILWTEDYINKWIKQTLLVVKAENNLSIAEKDVKKELDEYRNSLLVYRYKDQLMKEKLDTIVSRDEILKYYSGHKDEFFLTQDIVKAVYLKVPNDVAEPEIIKSLCKGNSLDDLSELNEYCISYAKLYDKFNDGWVPARLVLDNIPAKTDDLKSILRRNNFIETKDFNFYYLVFIRDFRFTGDAAPIDYVESQVKNLILNARKIQFLKDVEEDVFNEGKNSSNVKIFTIQK